MSSRILYKAFSLTEVLLAVATLAIGMLFIAGTFLAGIYLTTVAAERTTAAVVADEAFAKIKLYGINPTDPNLLNPGRPDVLRKQLKRFEDVAARRPVPAEEFAYPSTGLDMSEKQYYWSALCRRVDPNAASRLVQVTVFVTRKTASAASYPLYQSGVAGRPGPKQASFVAIGTGGSNVLTISPPYITWVNDGCTIVDDQTGQIYRVVQRLPDPPDFLPNYSSVELDRPWEGGPFGPVWVVPPPIGSGKDPCIAVSQKVIRF
jgi:hypothetical protein